MKYSSDIKEIKEVCLAKTIVYNLALSLFFTLVIAVALIKIFDVRLDQVLSDSMYPEITKRDIVVVVKQDEYKINDVIEYKLGNENVTHRIVALGEEENTFVTKGDANNTEDGKIVHLNNINGKIILIWENGRAVYNTLKNSYFVIIVLLIGAYTLSITIAGEKEMHKHNILKI